MKKFKNALSLASFIVIMSVVCMVSFMSFIATITYLADVLGIAGTFWALGLTPIGLAVSLGVVAFLFLGLKRCGTR